MSFLPRAVKQIHGYSITIADGATSGFVDVTNGENLSYSLIDIDGWTAQNGAGGGGAGITPGNSMFNLTVAGSRITATRYFTEGVVTIVVRVSEYVRFFMRQAVQRITTTLNVGVASQDSAAYNATTKDEIRPLGYRVDSADAVAQNSDTFMKLTRVDSQHYNAAKLSASYRTTITAEIVDWR
jgi:hypothetical protein